METEAALVHGTSEPVETVELDPDGPQVGEVPIRHALGTSGTDAGCRGLLIPEPA